MCWFIWLTVRSVWSENVVPSLAEFHWISLVENLLETPTAAETTCEPQTYSVKIEDCTSKPQSFWKSADLARVGSVLFCPPPSHPSHCLISDVLIFVFGLYCFWSIWVTFLCVDHIIWQSGFLFRHSRWTSKPWRSIANRAQLCSWPACQRSRLVACFFGQQWSYIYLQCRFLWDTICHSLLPSLEIYCLHLKFVLCVCVCVYVCLCVRTHTCVCTCIHVCMCVCKRCLLTLGCVYNRNVIQCTLFELSKRHLFLSPLCSLQCGLHQHSGHRIPDRAPGHC